MTFSIRLGNLEERLEHLSVVTKRPKSFYVKEALLHGQSIETLESIYLPERARESARAANVGQDLGKGLNLAGNQMSLV